MSPVSLILAPTAGDALVLSPQAEAPAPPGAGALGVPSRSSGPTPPASHRGSSPQRPCTTPIAGRATASQPATSSPQRAHPPAAPSTARNALRCPNGTLQEGLNPKAEWKGVKTCGHLFPTWDQKLLADITIAIGLISERLLTCTLPGRLGTLSTQAELWANAGNRLLQCRERKHAHRSGSTGQLN